MRKRRAGAIDAHGTGLHSLCHPQRPADVVAVHRRVQAKLGVDGLCHGLGLGLEDVDGDNGPEDLLAHAARVLGLVRHNRRRDEQAL